MKRLAAAQGLNLLAGQLRVPMSHSCFSAIQLRLELNGSSCACATICRACWRAKISLSEDEKGVKSFQCN